MTPLACASLLKPGSKHAWPGLSQRWRAQKHGGLNAGRQTLFMYSKHQHRVVLQFGSLDHPGRIGVELENSAEPFRLALAGVSLGVGRVPMLMSYTLRMPSILCVALRIGRWQSLLLLCSIIGWCDPLQAAEDAQAVRARQGAPLRGWLHITAQALENGDLACLPDWLPACLLPGSCCSSACRCRHLCQTCCAAMQHTHP